MNDYYNRTQRSTRPIDLLMYAPSRTLYAITHFHFVIIQYLKVIIFNENCLIMLVKLKGMSKTTVKFSV